MGCSGSSPNVDRERIKGISEMSRKEIDESNKRIEQYELQIQDYENQIDHLRNDTRYKAYLYDSFENSPYKNKQYGNSNESGVDLSSDEDEQRAEENRRNQDYVEIKIKGLQEEIKKLKAMQVVEQTNINEIQSKINKITMESNLRNTNKVKKELEKQSKNLQNKK